MYMKRTSSLFALSILVIALSSGLLVYLAQNIYLADSEIYAMNFSRYSISDHYAHFALLTKPVFTVVLKALSYTNDSGWDLFVNSRLVFSLISVGILILTYLISLKITKNTASAVFAVIALISTSVFLNRGYRVRSDILACLFFLASMFFLLIAIEKRQGQSKLYYGISIFFIIYSLLSTPKAVFFAFAYLVYAFRVLKSKFQTTLSKSLFELPLYFIISLILSFIIYNFSGARDPIIAASNYFLNSFGGPDNWTVTYFSMRSFHYLGLFLLNDYLFAGALTLSFLWFLIPSLKSVRNTNVSFQSWSMISILLIVVFIYIPDKLPFFLASLLPIFSIQISLMFDEALRFKNKFALSAFAVLALGFSYMTYQHQDNLLTNNNNHEQKIVWYRLNGYLSNYPDAVIYDAIGLFPYRKRIEAYPGPGMAEYKTSMINTINGTKPEFIFYTMRMYKLNDFIYPLIKKEYSQIGTQLYAKSKPNNYKPFDESGLKISLGLFAYDMNF